MRKLMIVAAVVLSGCASQKTLWQTECVEILAATDGTQRCLQVGYKDGGEMVWRHVAIEDPAVAQGTK
jgi:uncharacterized lipoprotein YmbA